MVVFFSNLQKYKPQKVKNCAFWMADKTGWLIINNQASNYTVYWYHYTIHLTEHLLGCHLSELDSFFL